MRLGGLVQDAVAEPDGLHRAPQDRVAQGGAVPGDSQRGGDRLVALAGAGARDDVGFHLPAPRQVDE